MKASAGSGLLSAPEYRRFIADLKARVMAARLSAARSVNRDLILLYWDIGRGIAEKQKALGWGESVVELVAADLQRAFPGMTGFSPRNVWDMKRFYITYSDTSILRQAVAELKRQSVNAPRHIMPQPVAESDANRIWPQAVANISKRPSSKTNPIWRQAVAKLEANNTEFLQQLVAEIPWGQNLLILNKTTDPAARLYYLRATAQFGWSRNVLLNQIKAGAYERAVTEKKTHNFDLALPEHLAEQADEMLKSSYNLEFLGIRREVKERELEDRLISRLQAFLLELGYGFCFVGRQHRIALGNKEYFIDLLSITAFSRRWWPSS